VRILALDMGERRTGVALSDPLGWLASPLTVLKCASREEEFASIEALVQKHQVERIVVGYPRSLNGSLGPQAQRVDRYVERLRARLPKVPVILWEEQFSTVQAEQLIRETGRRVNRETIDAAAAAVVLQSYLDAVSRSASGDAAEATAPSSGSETQPD
jgi:putative Holliday junction resolvase